MYLKCIHIKNFRAIHDCKIEFNESVNILIGENNAGKSAIIDALRICFSHGEPWKDIYVREDDFHLDKTKSRPRANAVEFHLFFKKSAGETDGAFDDFLVLGEDGSPEHQLHFRWNLVRQNGRNRTKLTLWGGENEGGGVSPETFDHFESVYLEALRDAVAHLKPSNKNRLGELYDSMVQQDAKDDLTQDIHTSLHESEKWLEVLEDGKKEIKSHLEKSLIRGKQEDLHIGFLPYEFRQIVNGLKLQLPAYDVEKIASQDEQEYFSLYQNGLGTNNLIYTAAVLGDLKKRREQYVDAFFTLLIEEPEAHLHPQLQNNFFSYLSGLKDLGVQLFVTSHSPTITAKTNLESLIVIQKQDHNISAFSLANSSLDEPARTYLHKFLDVTKSQLFFSEGVLFVEGISEALLVNELAKTVEGDYDLVANGIEVVNVNGVAFSHFAALFNDDENKLLSRAAILTDKDNLVEGELVDEELPTRASNAEALAGGGLRVYLADYTFEYELYLAGSNEEILMGVFKDLHPRLYKKISGVSTPEERAKMFVKALKTNNTKSEFAHRLAFQISESRKPPEEGEESVPLVLSAPEYIVSAIKWVIDGTEGS